MEVLREDTERSRSNFPERFDSASSEFRSEPAELGWEMRLAAAVKWFELGLLSQAKSAKIAGLSRYEFIHEFTRFGVSPIQETIEELAEGLAREK